LEAGRDVDGKWFSFNKSLSVLDTDLSRKSLEKCQSDIQDLRTFLQREQKLLIEESTELEQPNNKKDTKDTDQKIEYNKECDNKINEYLIFLDKREQIVKKLLEFKFQ
jgi:hypothetical protein